MKTDNKTFIKKWESQLRKGILDLIILHYLQDRDYYGYELINDIKHSTSLILSEGTIYPLLNRLKKEGLISSKWVEMETGIPRKYYRITEAGRKTFHDMMDSWNHLNDSIEKMVVKK